MDIDIIREGGCDDQTWTSWCVVASAGHCTLVVVVVECKFGETVARVVSQPQPLVSHQDHLWL